MQLLCHLHNFGARIWIFLKTKPIEPLGACGRWKRPERPWLHQWVPNYPFYKFSNLQLHGNSNAIEISPKGRGLVTSTAPAPLIHGAVPGHESSIDCVPSRAKSRTDGGKRPQGGRVK